MNAVEHTLATVILSGVTAFAENRMVVNRGEAVEWKKRKDALPAEIVAALQNAGYVIRSVGGEPETRVSRKALNPFDQELRVECDIPAMSLFGEVAISPMSLDRDGPRYVEHIARAIISKMTKLMSEAIFERITPAVLAEARKPIMPEEFE